MPGLLTLHTDLKSLKYGQDRPGGGNSGQPYITTDINTTDTQIPFDGGFMRYGIVGATQASETDRLRISKFLYDGTPGYLFITRQAGLQLSNPKLEVRKLNISGGPFLNFIGNIANRVNQQIGPTRIYNGGVNTLAQVPVNAFGTHFLRHGILTDQIEENKYENAVASNNEAGDNRLLKLTSKLQLGDNVINPVDPTQRLINRENRVISIFTNIFNTISVPLGGPAIPKFKFTPQQQIIDQYIGGPNSVYGVGQTVIRRYSNTEDGQKIQDALDRSKQLAGYSIDDKGGQAIVNYTSTLGGNNGLYGYYDNGKTISDALVTYNETSYIEENNLKQAINKNAVNYSNSNLKQYSALIKQVKSQQELFNNVAFVSSGTGSVGVNTNQFGIYKTVRDENGVINKSGLYESATNGALIGYKNSYGDVIKINYEKWSDISRENRVGSERKDQINLTPLLSRVTHYWYGNDTETYSPDGEKHNIRDLIKFAIQSVDTDDPSLSDFMIFRAYLTQFSDNVDAQWSDIKYAGRGNPFYIYNGFTRKIQIGFKVAALSKEEMAPMYSKLNYLMSSLMPDYKNNVMRGPLHRMTVGNYLDAQLGILNSISYTVPNDSPWEIAIDEPEGGTKMLILPHILEVSMTFTPIGAETQTENKIEAKDKNISLLAQNNTGGDVNTIQYYHSWLANNIYKKDKANAISPTVPPTTPQPTNNGVVDLVSQPNILST